MKIIQGKLVRLVPATVADAERILRAVHPDSVNNFTFWQKQVTLEEEIAYLNEKIKSGDQIFLIESLAGQTLVGSIGLHEIESYNDSARIGVMLYAEEHRGKHYSSEAMRLIFRYAFTDMRLFKIYAKVKISNLKSQTIDEHMGFRKVMIIPKDYKDHDGTFHDMQYMELTRPEWEEKYGKGE